MLKQALYCPCVIPRSLVSPSILAFPYDDAEFRVMSKFLTPWGLTMFVPALVTK